MRSVYAEAANCFDSPRVDATSPLRAICRAQSQSFDDAPVERASQRERVCATRSPNFARRVCRPVTEADLWCSRRDVYALRRAGWGRAPAFEHEALLRNQYGFLPARRREA